MKLPFRSFVLLSSLVLITTGACAKRETANLFQSQWPERIERTWVGPEFWANRLQDWRISGGRLECVEDSPQMPMRTVHLLTRRAGERHGSLEMSVLTGPVGDSANPAAMTGFLIGIGGNMDYRAAALVHHSYGPGGGLFAGIDGEGRLTFRDFSQEDEPTQLPSGIGAFEEIKLVLSVSRSATGYTLTLRSYDAKTDRRRDTLVKREIEPRRLVGNLALVSHPGDPHPQQNRIGTRFWFRDWTVAGDKLETHENRSLGPILGTQYTLSRNILKMTAQMMPVGRSDHRAVTLEMNRGGSWNEVASAEIIEPGFTATFRVEDWDPSTDTPYRVRYRPAQVNGNPKLYDWTGTIRHDPVEEDSLSLVAFTGNHNLGNERRGADHGTFPWSEQIWFPHADLTHRVAQHDPDMLFFSGDQVYELASPTQPQRSPKEKAELDYLYKWYLWFWAFRDLTRDRPTVTIPDDHDVFQLNLWGAGGRPTSNENLGGYVMPPDWVNMVQRTQTSHLPDPYDPTPIEQGISVYYTDLHYGRVSFAVIEDRKFKSGPEGLVPPTTSGRPDHVIDPDFDPTTADVPDATLLGERQLQFLEHWAADWEATDMKAVLSQTALANANSLYGRDHTRVIANYDSNGWPQTGRNEALKKIRKAYAVHITGDQHLATLIRHGVDDWNDAGLSFSVPSIANINLRPWAPLEPGQNRDPGAPEYTGEFRDGFGNPITVYAVTNPGPPSGRQPAALHDKMPGYGMVRFNKKDRTITFECWPRYADPETDEQYPGWPRTFKIEDNYPREPAAYLSTIELKGLSNPVVQVYRGNLRRRDLVYALRIEGSSFRPWVFEPRSHSVVIGEPGTEKMKTLLGMSPLPAGLRRSILVEMNP